MKSTQITINWHIISKCNYKCYYCFAKYDKYHMKPIYQSKLNIEKLLTKIYQYFKKQYNIIRLNIAGGEPTLAKNLDFIIQTAYKIGFEVSIITNSSKVNKKFIETNAKYLSMFGTSIDSLKLEINQKIGRIEKQTPLKISLLIQSIELLKMINPNIKLKINTVVNEYNYKEYLGDFINFIKPDKWKILQAFPFQNKIYCTDEQYNLFIDNHQNIKTNIFTENNNEMKESYIMIDPYGRFYQNSNNIYHYSNSILNMPIETTFNEINFKKDKYDKRYIKK